MKEKFTFKDVSKAFDKIADNLSDEIEKAKIQKNPRLMEELLDLLKSVQIGRTKTALILKARDLQ